MSSTGASPRRRGRTPDKARLIERFRRLAPQQQALRLACETFADDNGTFDRGRWAVAFDSQRPEDIRDVKAVTGLYEGLVNHLVEMLFVAARLCDLDIAKRDQRPTGPELFDAVGEDGGLTANQVEVLKRVYAMRNELQHASPGVEGTEVYDHVVLLGRTLRRFVTSYLAWLNRHSASLS